MSAPDCRNTAAVAACNAVGCGPPIVTIFVPTRPAVTVALTRGSSYTGPGCASGNCQHMHVEATNLTPNASLAVACFDSVDDRFKTVNLTADASGRLSADPCHMGFPGRQVWVTLTDPQRGTTASNTLTW